MRIKENVSLSKFTTYKVGGTAKLLYCPETEDELCSTASILFKKYGNIYILSGGSNLLIDDNIQIDAVIYMKKACLDKINLGDGRFYFGSSNRIQDVIHFVNEAGYGGFQELIGLPALFGGIICMNAGIGGRSTKQFTISDFVENVKIFDPKKCEISTISVEKCAFGHRKSVFMNSRYVILGATLRLHQMTLEEARRRIQMRTQFCKENFEYGKGCFGSCFSDFNGSILKFASCLFRAFPSGGCHFSSRNYNWLVNDGSANFKDTIRKIRLCKLMHKILFKRCEVEVVIWE